MNFCDAVLFFTVEVNKKRRNVLRMRGSVPALLEDAAEAPSVPAYEAHLGSDAFTGAKPREEADRQKAHSLRVTSETPWRSFAWRRFESGVRGLRTLVRQEAVATQCVSFGRRFLHRALLQSTLGGAVFLSRSGTNCTYCPLFCSSRARHLPEQERSSPFCTKV